MRRQKISEHKRQTGGARIRVIELGRMMVFVGAMATNSRILVFWKILVAAEIRLGTSCSRSGTEYVTADHDNERDIRQVDTDLHSRA